jgi:hypothetical protein
MRFRLVLFVSALAAVTGAGTAQAAPGDRAISDPTPGEFRLDPHSLEPGCFSPRFVPSNIDLSSFDLDVVANEELRVANYSGLQYFSYNIDQILVPAHGGGYQVYNSFNRHGDDIAPGEQEGEMFAPGDGAIENDDVILCVSDETAPQNEPYQQEAGGLVSAKNRPIIAPKVTALGVSAVEPLNTYKVGFGYDVESWYTMPTFDGHGFFDAVTDPEASFFGSDGLPNVVRLRARLDDLPYDARRVNDVDKAGESWTHGDASDGQDIYLRRSGDDTAWTDSNGNGLLTTLTQGDLPIQWSLRPSLAAPSSFREAQLTDDDLRAWNAAWQAYYRGTGPKPTMMLPPGTNSPTPDTTVIVNLPETNPSGPAPQQPAAVTHVTNTTNTTVNAGCVSNRVIKMKFGKKVRKASVRVGNRVVRAHRHGGKLRARVSLKGMKGQPGDYVTTVVKTKKAHRKASERVRMFKLC